MKNILLGKIIMKKTIVSLVSSLLLVSFSVFTNAAEKKHDDHNHHDHHGHDHHGHDHGSESKQVKHSAHEHGVAKMNIAVIGQEIQIELDSPAYNIVGFEHQPKNSKQHKTVKKAEQSLVKPKKLVKVENNTCTVENAKIESPFADHDDHAHHDHGKHAEHAKEGEETHSEYALEYHLVCDSAEIKQVDFSGLFKKFANFSEIRVQWLSNEKQGDAELSNANPIVTIQ